MRLQKMSIGDYLISIAVKPHFVRKKIVIHIKQNLHNIGLVNSGNTGPLIVSSIFESIFCNALTGLLCDELNTLYNSINNLK